MGKGRIKEEEHGVIQEVEGRDSKKKIVIAEVAMVILTGTFKKGEGISANRKKQRLPAKKYRIEITL